MSGMVLSLVLICYGIIGTLGVTVSYKFEIDDPSVEISINKLEYKEKSKAYELLQSRRDQLNNQSILFGSLIIIGITTIILLVIKRKQIIKIT
jgi:hypothetical protein